MPHVVESMQQLGPMIAAPRAVVLVSVPWSPWPNKARPSLATLALTRRRWSPVWQVEFFDLRPESDEELNRWYESVLREYWPRFELSAGGYGPFWWVTRGRVIDYLTKPYNLSLEELERRSAAAFQEV